MNRLFDETGGEHKKPMEVRMFVHTFSHPDERKEYLEMLQLGSQFDMRSRAIFYFYGPDLIAYKRKNLTSPQVNEFLRVFSTYLTTQLEDNCPASWEECSPEFWEELIVTCIPQHMKVTKKQKETRTLLIQLKRFVHWLDERTGCSWYEVVEKCVEENMSELKLCEEVLNDLHVHTFPHLFNKDWDPREDVHKIYEALQQCSTTENSIFEVSELSDFTVCLIDIDTKNTYHLIDFPTNKLAPGILIDGVIGKAQDDFYWTWYFAETVFPKKAKNYIKFID